MKTFGGRGPAGAAGRNRCRGDRPAAHVLKRAAANVSTGRLAGAASVLERVAAESDVDAADAASRRLSVEASRVIEVLRDDAASTREGHSCVS